MLFGDVRPFLEKNDDVAPKLSDQLLAIIDDPDHYRSLMLQLAATVDIGQHFVKATYDLEGDSALALCCYERLQAVARACRLNVGDMHMPNLRSVARNLATGNNNITVAEAEEYGRSCI